MLLETGVAAGTAIGPAPEDRDRDAPRMGIYTGTGASHSWLWFVDLLDGAGIHEVTFLDEADVRAGRLAGVDALAVAGGDTFALAQALGKTGAARLAGFVNNGGVYIGSCAGAYLPMRSSKAPLDRFNFADVKITNLTSALPEPRRMAEKFCTAYGCRYVFHPVRETVALTLQEPPGPPRTVEAPLYGGPGMVAGGDAQVLATYAGFTPKTLFLVDRDLATRTLVGTAAVVRQEMGRGVFYLLGPHLEHPRYPEANRFLVEVLCRETARRAGRRRGHDPGRGRPAPATSWVRDVKRELSNARIVAAGLEMAPLQWRIGRKIYEPAKIRVFLEALWGRIRYLERAPAVHFPPDGGEAAVRLGREITGLVRTMKGRIDDGLDTTPQATDLFCRLRELATRFLRIHFLTRAADAARSIAPSHRYQERSF